MYDKKFHNLVPRACPSNDKKSGGQALGTGLQSLSFTIYLEIVLQCHVSQQIVIKNMADFGQIYVILTSQFLYFH